MSASVIREPERALTVAGHYDVIVVGGGIGGVAAALAAARNGAKTLLLEKTFGLGGLATLGNVTAYLPLCDGYGNQIIGGIAEELLHRSIQDIRKTAKKRGFIPQPECWNDGGSEELRAKDRYDAWFNPYAFQLELEHVCAAAGVELWYDTRLCSVIQNQGMVTHVVVENKDGRLALQNHCVIDASGDADVCFMAGEETESLDNNVLAGWHYVLADEELTLRSWTRKANNTTGTRENAQGPFFRGDVARDVTGHIVQSREIIRQDFAAMRQKNPNVDFQPFGLTSIPCFRMTRRLVSTFSLANEHVHQWFDDAIGMTGHWWKRGPVYSMPYRTIIGARNRNLFAVGRCMSTHFSAWDVTRAIPTCACTGQAAGTAAAMAAATLNGDAHALSVPKLQQRLKDQGMILDEKLINPRRAKVAEQQNEPVPATH